MMPVSKPFPEQRTAVVTGCGSTAGIGRHVARQVALSGYQVAALDINPAVEQFAAELAAATGRQVVGIVCDVSDEAAVACAWERIDAELPQVVGLANVAAEERAWGDARERIAKTQALLGAKPPEA